MRKPKSHELAIAAFIVVVAVVVGLWLLLSGGSGWLCCITDPASGADVCVQVPSIDSECEGGEVGWCQNFSETATGQATCLDTK
jgi:hypothetical protein